MAANHTFQLETMDFTVNGNGWSSKNPETFKTHIKEPHGSKKTKKKIKLSVINCLKCNELIAEKHLYAIRENYWHKCCMKCDNCNVQPDESGFLIDTILLCRMCYNQSVHVTVCCGCKLPIQTHEVVMYALNKPYHLSCFKCNYCKILLSKGDKFVLQNELLICKHDYETNANLQSIQPTKQQSYKLDTPPESIGIRRKTKISNTQRQYLETYYIKNPNPSIKQRAYVAEELNLPVKVVQTWFCNYRTKMKTQRNNDLKTTNDDNRDKYCTEKMRRILNEHCFTPDQDCGTNCQTSQSTEDHTSPQDLSSDLSSGMYTYSQSMNDRPFSLSANHNPSIDDTGLTYADLSNANVKSIDQSTTGLTWS